MKDSMDSTAAQRAPEVADEFSNRKLIRPTMTRAEQAAVDRRDRPMPSGQKKSAPAEQTHAENFYYQKQIQSKTHIVVVLKDGEQLHGVIEWYDRDCIKLNRFSGHANLLIYKPSIKYIYKDENGRK